MYQAKIGFILVVCSVFLVHHTVAARFMVNTALSDFGLDTRPVNATCHAPARPSTGTPVGAEAVFSALEFSDLVALGQPRGNNSQWFAAERKGQIWTFANDEAVTTKTLALDISERVRRQGYSGGLIGMAFHPNFASNGLLFLFYTRPGEPADAYVSSFALFEDSVFDADSEQVILVLSQTTSDNNHTGGNLVFGPDRYLYISFGDDQRECNGQDVETWGGAILRIDVDQAKPYAIPPDNPFAMGGGRPEIYAWGFRNPWRGSFDRLTGDFWVGDVGSNMQEEINLVTRGGNYGWNIRLGLNCRGMRNRSLSCAEMPSEPIACDHFDFIDPVVTYDHDEGNAVIGGYVYRGRLIPELQGSYIYGDISQKIWGLFYDQTGKPMPQVLVESLPDHGGLRSFAEDNEGELYAVFRKAIYRLVPQVVTPNTTTLPQLLSETGCVDPQDPAKPAPGLIPYDVNVPLWSDGAAKQRWMALPNGSTIHIEPDGNWVLPIGTVLVKSFTLADTMVETRLLVRHEDGEWAGYTYKWNDAQTDAVLLPRGMTQTIHGQRYTIPSRSQCLQCHTAVAGRSLGLETAQLNRSFRYPSTGREANQLATLAHIGLFDMALPATPETLPQLPVLTDQNAPLDRRARGYLHANCSHCHRAGGPGGGPADFRFDIPFANMNVCDVRPEVGDLDIPDARLLSPGKVLDSIISLRMQDLGEHRMPPIGTHLVDREGVALVDAWISSLQACP